MKNFFVNLNNLIIFKNFITKFRDFPFLVFAVDSRDMKCEKHLSAVMLSQNLKK